MIQCPRCAQRGKTWPGHDPECAFRPDGTFRQMNYSCATMDALRDLAELKDEVKWTEDQKAALFPIPNTGQFALIGWYKNRGRVEAAFVLDECEIHPLTLAQAELILKEAGV